MVVRLYRRQSLISSTSLSEVAIDKMVEISEIYTQGVELTSTFLCLQPSPIFVSFPSYTERIGFSI